VFHADFSEQEWTSARQWSAADAGVDAAMAAVLTTTGSLTRFMERHHGMKLDLRVMEQFVDCCRAGEAELLNVEDQAQCLRRRVTLLHRGSVMFDAESVLPLESLPAELMGDLQDGKIPLGNLLLDRGLTLSRSDLCIARIAGSEHARLPARWARRSVLRAPSGTTALVIECFRPEMWRRMQLTAKR
jgi:chorismate-pyruvate lyase